MTKNILIGLNIIALLVSIYWLTAEIKAEPFITLILTIANLVGLKLEDKINTNIFKTKVNIATNNGNSAGTVHRQKNYFGSSNLKKNFANKFFT